MKTLFLMVALILFFVGGASGAPFLVADPPDPAEQVTHYIIYQDGVLLATYTGEVLNYDLVGVTPGSYDYLAEACNVWGCERTPDPYVSPSPASIPSGLTLTP